MFRALFEKLQRHEDLGTDEAAAAMTAIMRGEAAPAQTAGLLIGLSMKGERPEELVGLASAMRAEAVTLAAPPDVFDTCGTGGDRSGTFNISTAAALVVAACGVRVAKHGNRSVSSRCGSADVLEALGVGIAASPQQVERCLHEVGLAFLFAPTFHPAMRHAAQPRQDLGVRTAFNLLGPLTNPARPRRQIVGVPRPELTELIARALLLLGSQRAWVIHGADGLDELSTTGYSKVSECHEGIVRTFYVHPADYGLPKCRVDALHGGEAAVNAQRVREVLAGTAGPARDVVLLNAAAALFVAGHAGAIREGLTLAAEAIDSGRAADVLSRLVAATQPAAHRHEDMPRRHEDMPRRHQGTKKTTHEDMPRRHEGTPRRHEDTPRRHEDAKKTRHEDTPRRHEGTKKTIHEDAPRRHEGTPRRHEDAKKIIHEDAPRRHEDTPRRHEDTPRRHEGTKKTIHEDAPRRHEGTKKTIHGDMPPRHEDAKKTREAR